MIAAKSCKDGRVNIGRRRGDVDESGGDNGDCDRNEVNNARESDAMQPIFRMHAPKPPVKMTMMGVVNDGAYDEGGEDYNIVALGTYATKPRHRSRFRNSA